MVLWDDRLLELARRDGHISPKEAEDSGFVHISNAQISRRLSKLADHGLLQKLPNGVYTLTAEGRQYLNGELNVEDLSDENNGSGKAEA
jgi:Mn-dependent DtxR family transcriptional regulator